jgi:hypothetical protein
MKNETIRTMVLCGVAGFALALQAAPKDPVTNAGGAVDFYATVSALRDVPAGNPLPGLHLDAKVKGRSMDVYIAPMYFVAKYGVKVAKGDEVRIVGTLAKSGDTEVVLSREITTGSYDNRAGIFKADLTVYLRNDDGPFFTEELTPGPAPVAAH